MRRLICLVLCGMLLVFPIRAAQTEKVVALTFDDGPSGKYTQRLLDGLAQRGVKATFLLCGYRLKDYPDTARRIFDEGHEIGLHGYSHDNMRKMTRTQVAAEIAQTAALLPAGCKPVFLRPPGGACSETVCTAAKDAGLAVLTWSVDPRDWATTDAVAVEASVIQQVGDGDVILLHDMTNSSVDAALSIVDTLQVQGFRFVTVSELALAKGIVPQPGEVYCRFR